MCIDKITRYAPHFKEIVIRRITFAPYRMQTMFRTSTCGQLLRGLLHPDLMGPNRPAPKGFHDLYLAGAGGMAAPTLHSRQATTPGYQVLDDLASAHPPNVACD